MSFNSLDTSNGLEIVVDARTIESLDLNYTTNFFKMLDTKMPISLQNNINISVYWAPSDNRELYDIPEVRTYFSMVFDAVDSLFFWINPYCEFFVMLCHILYPPKTRYRMLGCDTIHVEIDPNCLASYIVMGFEKLNRFCDSKGLSEMPSSLVIEQRITELLSEQSQ